MQGKVLAEQVKEAYASPKIKELIKEVDFILWFEQDHTLTGRIDKQLVDTLKVFYDKLGLNELIMLWLDNYNSMMIQKKEDPDNHTSYLVRNKVLALGTLINKQL